MMRSARFLIAILIYILCSGCNHHDAVPPPDVKMNPNPHMGQRFVISITGQVDEIAGLQGKLQYDIANNSCVPIDRGRVLGGIRPQFTKYSSFNINSVAPGAYEAIVYRDLYVPFNYYGVGICEWSITSMKIHILRYDGRKETATFDGQAINYGAHAGALCGPRVGGFGCAPDSVHMSVDASYRLSITSGKE